MNKPTVLVVYHYFARYRLPVLRALAENEEIDFKFVSGVTSEINIEKISPKLARKSVSAGGLEWRFVENVWVKSGVILWQKGLISKCAFGRFDAVIFLGSPYFLTTWLAAIFCRVRRKRVLFWTHGVLREGGWKDTFRKLFFKISNGLLLYSDWAKGNLSQNGFESDKLFVIKNSLDYEAHRELRAMLTDEKFINKKCELFSEPDLPLLMFIGRLTPQKKLSILVALVNELHERGTRVNLLLIGDGEARSELESEVKSLGITGNTVFFGACYDENELALLVGMADICIAPGEVGLTAIHSMSFGTPVITHNDPLHQMPEFESIVEGETGSFFERGSLESLVECTHSWLVSNQDRKSVKYRCFSVVDSFYNPDYQVKMIIKAINND
jgi:glycosyltransferase involved in cell wall biosynthesis